MFVSNARSKFYCIAKRFGTRHRSARNATGLTSAGRIGTLALWLWDRKRIRKLQFVELNNTDFAL